MLTVKTPRKQLHFLLLAVIILIGIASRLPQLYSTNMILDGDECVVGLMAKHITEGKDVPVYFYGQKYGFAYFEAMVGAISFKLFGYGAFQLKAGMLAIWLGGLAFFYLTAVRVLGVWQGFFLTLVFTVFPAWAVWSLKARGGYLTSFFLGSGLLYFFVKRKTDFKPYAWFLIGIILAFIFYAQAFWIAALLPFLGYHFIKHPKKLNLVWLLLGFCLVFLCFHFFATYTTDFWKPKVIGHNRNLLNPIILLPSRIWWHLTGSYYLNLKVHDNLGFVRITIVPFIGISLLALGLQFYRGWHNILARKIRKASDNLLKQLGDTESVPAALLKNYKESSEGEKYPIVKALYKTGYRNRAFFEEQLQSNDVRIRRLAARVLYFKGKITGYLFFLSTCFILGYCIFLNEFYYGYRYLLPLSSYVFLWLGVEIDLLTRLKLIPRKPIIVIGLIMFIAGSISLYNYKKYSVMQAQLFLKPTVRPVSEEQHLDSLHQYLKAHKVNRVFTTDQLLEWLPTFYSNEEIICRAIPPLDRYPLYPKLVNEAYAKGEPTAFIDYYPRRRRYLDNLENPKAAKRVGHWYMVYLNPTKEELVRLGIYKIKGKPAPKETIRNIMRKELLKKKAILKQPLE